MSRRVAESECWNFGVPLTDKSKYKEWIDLVEGYLDANSKMYDTNSKKIGFVLSFMTSGNAAKWWIMKKRAHRKRALNNTQLPIDWKDFTTKLRDKFTLINNKGGQGLI